MSTTDKQKEELRKKLLERRQSIELKEFQNASAIIIGKLLAMKEIQENEVIHCYVSMNSRREVNTHNFIKRLLALHKKVVVPVTKFSDKTLKHVTINSFDQLTPNKWGVFEPDNGTTISSKSVDVVVVPMVGADEKCNRIGYGEGFYDRFLSHVTGPKIGLVFERNVEKQLPTEKFDVPMNKIITEQRIIECASR